MSHAKTPIPYMPLGKNMETNRRYNCQQRNHHYEKSFQIFHHLQSELRDLHQQPTMAQMDLLRHFNDELEVTLNYAREAIGPFYRKRLNEFRTDRKYGVLKEELLLVYFLEEMLSSTRYLLRRIQTDAKLEEFAQGLQQYKKQHEELGNDNEGFVSHVLSTLSSMKEGNSSKFDQIIPLIHQRYQESNQLFSLLRELQNF
jgi:hypothetical protein